MSAAREPRRERPRPEATATVHRLLGRADRKRALVYAAAALLPLAAVVLLGREVEHHLRAAEAWLAAHGAWGLAAFAVVYLLATSLLVPESPFAVVAGALFGLAAALPALAAAALAAALLQYALARGLLRERVGRMLAAQPSLAAIERAVLGDELRLQLLLRLTPLNPASVSYLLGAAGVRPVGFLLAALAILPHLFLETYLGYAGRHVVRVAGRASRSVLLADVALVAGLLATVAVMVVVSRMARRAVAAAAGNRGERPRQ